MTCSAHAHQGTWMRPNARALVHHVHRAGSTLSRSHGVMVSSARSRPLRSGCLQSRPGQSSTLPQQVQCPAAQRTHPRPPPPCSLSAQGHTARAVPHGPHGSNDTAVLLFCTGTRKSSSTRLGVHIRTQVSQKPKFGTTVPAFCRQGFGQHSRRSMISEFTECRSVWGMGGGRTESQTGSAP